MNRFRSSSRRWSAKKHATCNIAVILFGVTTATTLLHYPLSSVVLALVPPSPPGGHNNYRRFFRRDEDDEAAIGGKFHVQTVAAAAALRFPKVSRPNFLKSAEEREAEAVAVEEEAALKSLAAAPVRLVVAPNSTVIPAGAVTSLARRAEVLGRPISGGGIQRLASFIKEWYRRNGYVANSLTRVNVVKKGVCHLEVEEYVADEVPVEINFVKEVVIIPDDHLGIVGHGDSENEGGYVDGNEEMRPTMSYRAYRKKMSRRSKSLCNKPLAKEQMNSTLVKSIGRTNPYALAEALDLYPGRPFRWEQWRWDKVARSGLFAEVEKRVTKIEEANVSNVGQPGKVRLDILAREAPCRTLDYGVTKSLYTGGWEGELAFEHRNVLGGGEVAGVVVRRGAHDPEPSVNIQIRDSKLGCAKGYSVDLFNEYIGDGGPGFVDTATSAARGIKKRWWNKKDTDKLNVNDYSTETNISTMDEISSENDELAAIDDSLLISSSTPTTSVGNSSALFARRGGKVRFEKPLEGYGVSNSAATASLERTSTTDGIAEIIGSASMDVGPFIVDNLPLDARHSLMTTVTCGSRFVGTAAGRASTAIRPSPGKKTMFWRRGGSSDDGATSFSAAVPPGSGAVRPFSSATVVAREIFPLTHSIPGRSSVDLALRHSLTVSTASLPRHEAKAIGNAAAVRGYADGCNGPLSAAITGTAEVRVPITLRARKKTFDPTVVIFGDWMVGRPAKEGGIYDRNLKRHSVGAGLRNTLQGIPIKYDVSYSGDGKISASFGIGHDFDIL